MYSSSCIYMYALQVSLLCIVSGPCGISRHQQLYGLHCPSQAYSQAARLGCSATLCNPSTVKPHCAAHCCRLAQHYQLQLVSAKTILAAADELGGSTKQVVDSRQLCANLNSVCAVCNGSQLDALVNLVLCIAQCMKGTNRSAETDVPCKAPAKKVVLAVIIITSLCCLACLSYQPGSASRQACELLCNLMKACTE
jgi:hypothetical protein